MSQSIVQLYEIAISLMCMDGSVLCNAEDDLACLEGIENMLTSFVRITQS